MDPANTIILVLLAGTAIYWLVAALRVGRARGDEYSIEPFVRSNAAATHGLVSIVIPVHNEERVIDRCAESLTAQDYPDLQIIFVLDRCTDRTRAMLSQCAARDPRIELVFNETCPAGWAGKCHAARLGASRARGEWLLFTDADTQFDPALIGASVRCAQRERSDLLSLLGTLTCEAPFKLIAQPVASLRLIMLYPIERVARVDRPRAFANGQFLLFSRRAYEEIGGHESVREDLLEDLAFARRCASQGKRIAVRFAGKLLRVSMYDSFRAFDQGWRRIFIEACHRRVSRLRAYGLRLIGIGVGGPLLEITALILGCLQVIGGRTLPGLAVCAGALCPFLLRSIALSLAYRRGGIPLRCVWFFAPGAFLVGRTLLLAARDLAARRPIRWGGREYVIEPR